MLEILQTITHELRKVIPESYYEINSSDLITYPYSVFNLTSESLENTREGFYLDIDIWDKCYSNGLELERLCNDIKKHFETLRIKTDSLFMMFEYKGRLNIPTQMEEFKRRQVNLYIKVDRRA